MNHIIKLKKTNKASEKDINFEVYEPYNKTKLNLSVCDEKSINIIIPATLSEETKKLYEKMKESGYDMFDKNSAFYQDICTPFDSDDGTDILLSDRMNYIFNNEDTRCQSNCELSFYSLESEYINCSCSTNKNTNNKKIDKFSSNASKYSNYDIIKCINIIDIKTIFSKNIGSIIVLVYFVGYLTCLIIFIFKGIKPLKVKLRNNIQRPKESNDFKIKKNLLDSSTPPQRKLVKKLVLRTEIKRKLNAKLNQHTSDLMLKNEKKVEDKIQIFSRYNCSNNSLNCSPEEKINNLYSNDIKLIKTKKETEKDEKEEKEEKAEKKEKEKKLEIKEKKERQEIKEKKVYDDYELNEMEYYEAVIYDKRSLLQTYWATLKREHLIIFTFISCKDYNLLYIKLSRFLFLLTGDMAFNTFFFSDDSMHKLYINYGKYDFFQQIPQIVYSTIISQLIEVFLCFLSLTDKHIYRIKSMIKNDKRNLIAKIIKCMYIKLIIFYVFTFIFFVIYWYIISVFCGVYKNTQKHFIKDSIISFSICLVYPLALYFLSASLRIISLRYHKKKLKCLYNLSSMIPIF